MIKKIDHLVLTTANPEAILRFYDILGFQLCKGEGRIELFTGDFKINVQVLGKELSPHAGNVQSGSLDLCFELMGSLSSFVDKLKVRGVEIESGPILKKGVKGFMNSIYLRDPDKNLIEFCSYHN